MDAPDKPKKPSWWVRVLCFAAWAVVWLAALVCAVWATGALYFDLTPYGAFAATAWVVVLLLALIYLPGKWLKLGAVLAGFVLVLMWWLTLKPSNNRPWQPDVAQTPWSETASDIVTLHNVRHCDYRTETDYTAHWETRLVRLSQLTGVDMAITYWGSPWMAHPIVSFQFADAPPVCFSIETRKEVGESYSAVRGFYRQFELVYICSDERDVIRLRTNFRQGEDVYLYHLNLTPEAVRARFLDYVAAMNELREHPRWYNAATTNCTTSIRTQHDPAKRMPWDWRMLLNGKGDEMMYEHGQFISSGLPFPKLKERSLINPAAKAADTSPDFSAKIREGLPRAEK